MALPLRNLGTRAKHLLLALLHEQGPVVIANLARRFGVSPRSIRYDLDEIEAWLEGTSVTLCRRPRVGIWIEGAEEGLALAREQLGLVEEYRPVLSPEERRNIIISRLLQRDEPVTSHALADELHVSRTTVFADLDNVQAWLDQRGLSLVRRSNYGLRVVGEEAAWRQGVSDLLNEFAESGELGRLLMQVGAGGERASTAFAGAPHLLALLGGVDLVRVEDLVRSAEKAAGVEFTTGSYSALVFHVAVAIQRLTQDKEVELSRERLAALKSYPEYALARQMAAEIEKAFSLAVPDCEVGNLTIHLIGAKVRGPALAAPGAEGTAGSALVPRYDVEASAAARLLIREVEANLGLDLKGDEALARGLALHFRPVLGRLRFGLPVTNPLLADIQASYPRIYAATKKASAAVESLVGLSFPPEEIGHLAMHIGAAVYRRRRGSSGKHRVVVASTGGVGVNEILSARLNVEFPELEVVATSSVHGLAGRLADLKPDFVISTSSVPGLSADVVVVSPLLGEDDVARIRTFLDRTYRPSEDRLLAEVKAG